MKYSYYTATSTTEIELDEYWCNILIGQDKEEYNSNRIKKSCVLLKNKECLKRLFVTG